MFDQKVPQNKFEYEEEYKFLITKSLLAVTASTVPWTRVSAQEIRPLPSRTRRGHIIVDMRVEI